MVKANMTIFTKHFPITYPISETISFLVVGFKLFIKNMSVKLVKNVSLEMFPFNANM